MIFKRITISAANPTVRWFYIDSVRNSINTRPNWLPFYGAKYGNFKQEAPILPNQFKENLFLRNYLCQHFTKEVLFLMIRIVVGKIHFKMISFIQS